MKCSTLEANIHTTVRGEFIKASVRTTFDDFGRLTTTYNVDGGSSVIAGSRVIFEDAWKLHDETCAAVYDFIYEAEKSLREKISAFL